MEEINVEVVDEAQEAPLLKPVDNTLCSRKHMRAFMHVLRSIVIFKAGAAPAASAYVHRGRSNTTERKPEVAHGRTNGQSITDEMIVKNISKIVREKNFIALQEFGGLRGVAGALNTNLVAGISDNEYHSRLHVFSLCPAPARRFSYNLVLEALKGKTIPLLFLAATLSLGFGIKQEGLKSGWFDGVILLITIIVLVVVSSIHKYWKERMDRKKLEKQHFTRGRMEEVHVIRGGEPKHIYKSKLVCGDVVLLKKGYEVPADGLFIPGQALELDYGSQSHVINEENPFLSCGERVINGDARMVVTPMETNTRWGEMMSKATSNPHTKFKLQAHLDKLNNGIHNTGLVISIVILVVLFLRYMVGKMDQENGYRQDPRQEPTAMGNFAYSFRNIIQRSKYTTRALIKLLSVSLVGITEGVPFVVSLAICYCNHETLSTKAAEQDSLAIAKMASVTRICTGTFGDFTEDEMEVDKLFIGREVITGCTLLSPVVVESLCNGMDASKEKPFLHSAKDMLGLKKERMIQRWKSFKRNGKNPFEEPCGALMMRGTEETDEMFLHLNGPVKEIMKMCKHYYDSKGDIYLIDDKVAKFFEEANKDMLHKQLRTIAFACKSTDTQALDADDLILVAVLGLKSKSWEHTRKAVEECKECRIETVIVSSKKLSVLHEIGFQCGVITDVDSESSELTGEVFRKFTEEERLEKVDKIRVMGEAFPSDKLLLVECLRKKDEVVAFLGQRTDEVPTLKGADIGIAMGTWSSIKARESSEIIMWDGSFVDLISIVNSGKCIYHNIELFLQPVLIMTISSTLINFFGTIAFGDASLTAVQLVWIYLAVVFLGGFALLTKPSTDKLVSLVPVRSIRSLITTNMTINILAQVLYQTVCLMTLQAKGSGVTGTSQYIKTMVSNSFILCQFFNQFNAREIKKKNFFRGIHRHKEFWVAVATFIVLQVTFVMVQDLLGYGTRSNWKLWTGCVVVGAMSWPVDWLGKCASNFYKKLGNT